jgi:hypothetical protein
MPIAFLVQLVIGIAMNLIGYLLMPKPKTDKPDSMKDMDNPTAESGRPIPVPFGSMTISSLNNMGFWDKETIRRDVSSGGKK